MNKTEFITLIDNPKNLDKSHITALKNIAADFPYFQASHILLSKALFNENHYEFEKQLKLTALLVSDRELLYRFLHDLDTDAVFAEPNFVRSAEQEIVEITEVFREEMILGKTDGEPAETLEEIELPKTVDEADPNEGDEISEGGRQEIVLEKKVDLPVEELPVEDLSKTGFIGTDDAPDQNEIAEITEETGQEIVFEKTIITPFEEDLPIEALPEIKLSETMIRPDQNEIAEQAEETVHTTAENEEPEIWLHQNETHSFAEWLTLGKVMHKNQKVAENRPGEETEKKVKDIEMAQLISDQKLPAGSNIQQFESILDRFIKENPRISRPKAEFYNPAVMANHSNEEDDDLVTETLANIYYKQGAYRKAIRAYEKLCLIYPHKMTFFADLIQKIKEENKNE